MKRTLFIGFIIISSICYSQNNDSILNARMDNIEEKLKNNDSINNSFQTGLKENQLKVDNDKSSSSGNLIVSIFSLLIAGGLLIITVSNNKKSRRIIENQITEQRKLSRAQIRPIVHAYKSGFKEKTELIMYNYGGGPAVIKDIWFEKDGIKTRTISELIDIKSIHPDIWWDDKWTFTQDNYYLYPHQKISLYLISKEKLLSDKKLKFSEKEAFDLIEKVRKEREGIYLKVIYTDILNFDDGNIEPDFFYKLHLGKDNKSTVEMVQKEEDINNKKEEK